MKIVTLAFILLFATLIAVIVNSAILTSVITDIYDEVNEIDDTIPELARVGYEKAYEKYSRYYSFISLTVNHEDLTDIENSFAEIIGAATAQDTDAVITIKSRLLSALLHLRRLSGINLDSVF